MLSIWLPAQHWPAGEAGQSITVKVTGLAGSLVPTTVQGHQFWKETEPGIRANQRVHFFKNVSLLGGLLMATLDPDPHKKILPRRAKDRAVEKIDQIRN